MVVHDALETTVSAAVAFSWFTPITNIGASAEGAEIITFFAPPTICALAVSLVVKKPVHSATTSASIPASSHLI